MQIEPIIPKEVLEEIFKKAGFDSIPNREEATEMLNGLKSDCPSYLFRYSSYSRVKQILEEKRIFIQTPAKMNDLFDFQPILDYNITKTDALKTIEILYKRDFFINVSNKLKIEDFISKETDKNIIQQAFTQVFGDLFIEIFEQQRFSTKILCFSEKCDNQLLWAHYGDNFSGICLQLNFTSMDTASKLSVHKVKYVDQTPILNIFDYFINPYKYLTSLIKSMTVKNTDWTYEQEWRLILADQFQTFKDINFIPLRPDFISKIIFGVRTPFEQIIELMKLVEKDNSINFFKCFLDERRNRKIFFGHINKIETIKTNDLKIIEFYSGFENNIS